MRSRLLKRSEAARPVKPFEQRRQGLPALSLRRQLVRCASWFNLQELRVGGAELAPMPSRFDWSSTYSRRWAPGEPDRAGTVRWFARRCPAGGSVQGREVDTTDI